MFESMSVGTEDGELPADPCAGSWWHLPDQAPPVDDRVGSFWPGNDGTGNDWAGHDGAGNAREGHCGYDDGRPLDRVDSLLASHLAGLLAAEPGGVLAAALQDATSDGRVADLSDDSVISAAVAAQRLLGWAMGAQLIAFAELCRRWEASPLGERSAVAEVALACGLSEYAAWQRRDAAGVLPNRLPAVWAALVAGRLEWAKAYEIMDRASVLTDAAAASVEAAALEVAASSNLPELRAFLARAVLEADPEGAAERARAAHARRSVTFRPGPDATGTMALTASAAAVASAEASLNLLTSLSRSGEAEESAGRDRHVTRADVLLDLIESAAADRTGKAEDGETEDGETEDGETEDGETEDGKTEDGKTHGPGRPRRVGRTSVVLTVPLSTVLGLDETPGDFGPYGPIPAAMAREVAALAAEVANRGVWRCAVTDDSPGAVHGTVLGLGRSTRIAGYVPGASVRGFVERRDGVCRFPGCRRQAAGCDLDHRDPWRPSGGGVTCECNLQAVCANHHRLKHEARFAVARERDGVLAWTTPTGRTYRRSPSVLPHVRPPDRARMVDHDPPPF